MDEILLIGEINLDIYIFNKNVGHTDKYILKPGGVVINIAYSLKKLGLNSNIYSYIGNDMIGEGVIRKISEDFKIDLIKKTRYTNIIIYFITEEKINLLGLRKENPKFLLSSEIKNYLEKSKIVHISPYIFFNEENYELIKKLIKYDFILSINLSIPLLKTEKFIEYLKYFNYIFMNYEEAKFLTKSNDLQKIKKILKESYENSVVTMNDSVFYISKDKELKIDYEVYENKVTIGAGDYFIGGFLYGLYKKISIDESIKIGNKIAKNYIIYLNSKF